MDQALPGLFGRLFGRKAVDETATEETTAQTTARFGGDGDDEPVLIGRVHGPIEVEMAKDALREAGIPALVKQSSVGAAYGLSIGSFGSADVWVLPQLAEQAHTLLVGMGLIEDNSGDDPAEDG